MESPPLLQHGSPLEGMSGRGLLQGGRWRQRHWRPAQQLPPTPAQPAPLLTWAWWCSCPRSRWPRRCRSAGSRAEGEQPAGAPRPPARQSWHAERKSAEPWRWAPAEQRCTPCLAVLELRRWGCGARSCGCLDGSEGARHDLGGQQHRQCAVREYANFSHRQVAERAQQVTLHPLPKPTSASVRDVKCSQAHKTFYLITIAT